MNPSLSLSTLPSRRLMHVSDLMLLLVALVWGSSYAVAKSALQFYPVLGFLALRFGLTFALLLPSWLRTAPAQRRAALRSGLPLGLMMLSIFLCETFGLALTLASNAAFLISLCVVFTPFVEWGLLRRRPARALFAFAALSLLGAALLSGGLQGQLGLGDALMLAAALLRALTVCMTAKLSQKHPAPALALTTVQAAVIALGCLALAWAQGWGGTALSAQSIALLPLPSQAAFWWATVYLVLGCTVFAFFAQNWALKHSTPSRVALLTSSEPAFGALFAVLGLGEQLGPQAWLGGGLIVLAALWTSARRP